MKNTIQDRLILLATAQEAMADVAVKINQWDDSQLMIEKSAYESINTSDEVLNLSKEGSLLVSRLLECCSALVKKPGVEEQLKTQAVLEDLHNVFLHISQASSTISEVSHRIEKEAAAQKEIEDGIMDSLQTVSESLDEAVACAELFLVGDDII